MNNNYNMLVKLLTAAIHNSIPENLPKEDYDWNIIFNEVEAHQLSALLFPVIKKLDGKYPLPKELVERWQKQTFLTAVNQLKHIKQISKVIFAFNKAGIQVIALKGLILRALYPRAELRTMVDADLLIRKEDLEAAKHILISMGYYEDDSNPIHLGFIHNYALPIELHWSLINEEHISLAKNFEVAAWNNTELNVINNIPVLVFNTEYQLLHILLHMAVHTLHSGFGLRQLCDLTLFIETYKNSVNWTLVASEIKKCGLENFVSIVLNICSVLLGLKIPPVFGDDHHNIQNSKYFSLFIDKIICGGTHGERDISTIYGDSILYYPNYKEYRSPKSKFLYFTKKFFPPANELGTKFSYAHKYPILIPIAWCHRFIYLVLRKDLTFGEKRRIISSVDTYSKKRDILLKWLQLY